MDLTLSSQATTPVPEKGDEILQNAISSFRTVLTPEQLVEFDSIQSVPDTDAVLVFTAELDLRRRSQKGKSIASRLFPVLQAVHSFTAVINTFISSNPTIAALVWGSVKLTMMTMLNAASYYEAFAELFMNLGTICPRFEQYQALFPNSERLQVALCNFNASIIRCCQHVIAMPKSSSGWSSPLNPLNASFWQSFQQAFESDLQELRGYSKNVKEEIRLAQAQSEHRNREIQRMENDQAGRSRGSLARFMSRTRDDFDTMHKSQILRAEQLEREKNQKLLDSLSSHDYIKPLKQARQKRYPQSASWIFNTGEFKRWAEGANSRLLWCSGKMGSGKTILAASVIDYLLTERPSAKSHVAFFFSRFDDSESLRSEAILRAIARQLVNIQDVSGYTKQALENIQSANGDVSSELSYLLAHLLTRGGRPTWIVIDGIDECHKDERQKIIEALGSMLAVGPNVKLFGTGRDHANSMIKRVYPGLVQVSMSCPLAQGGMAELVDQAVQKCLDTEELLVSDQELITEIKDTLTQHADGMNVFQLFLRLTTTNLFFRILWVTLVLRDLCTQPNNEKIRDAIALRNLPRSLTDTFNRALERIISEGKESITQALLPWIVAAKQPLTLSQLEECCLISVLQEYTIKDRKVNGIKLIDTWFQGLVEIDYETKTVHLVHASVQQFFLTTPVKSTFDKFYVRIKEANRHLGEVCVTYLNFNDFKTTLSRRLPPLPPMAPSEICQKALGNEWGWSKFLRLSRSTSGSRRRALDVDGILASYARASDATAQETMVLDHPFLLYASAYWLSHSVNFNKEQCRAWNLWSNMLINGHELAASPVSEEHHQAIDEALVLWATCNSHLSLLHVVATSRELLDQFHPTMFDYVFEENNPDLLCHMLNTKEWDSMLNPLCCRATRKGLLEIVMVLVEAGADIDSRNSDSHDLPLTVPLMEAVDAGHIDVLQYLLQKGADPNSSTPVYRNALEPAATLGGSKGIQACKMLINAGADPKAGIESIRDDNALQRACKRGEWEIVKLLLDAGADVNHSPHRVVGNFDTALELSIESEDIQAINLVLSYGADVNVHSFQGNTALLAAFSLEKPRLDIFELLIRAGAKVNPEGSIDEGRKLLQEAVRSRNCDLVKLLIKEGANFNRSWDLDGDNIPLALAADDGLFEIMHILLNAGARVKNVDRLTARIPRNLRNGKDYEELLSKLKLASERNKEISASDRRRSLVTWEEWLLEYT